MPDEAAATAMRDRALRAAVALAEAHGLSCADPVVLAERSNLLVHLRPAPVIARVALVTATVRPGPAWLTREVAVASHLACRGAPVVAPSAEIDPGPHDHDGLPVTFWEYVAEIPGALDARAAGRALRLCHEALTDFGGDLPEHAIFREAREIVASLTADGGLAPDDAALLARAGARLAARIDALDVPLQPVHGDAHLSNVIQTARGPLWNDWEDAFRGPRAWDLACLHASARVFGRDPAPVAAAQAGYGDEGDPEVLDLLVDARAFVGAAWTLVARPHREGGATRIARRLDWLRAREASGR